MRNEWGGSAPLWSASLLLLFVIRHSYFPPPFSPLRQQRVHERPVAIRVGAVAALGVPVAAFLGVAAGMGEAEVQQVIVAAERAGLDVIDIRPEAGTCVEAEPAVADQALAMPAFPIEGEGIVG